MNKSQVIFIRRPHMYMYVRMHFNDRRHVITRNKNIDDM